MSLTFQTSSYSHACNRRSCVSPIHTRAPACAQPILRLGMEGHVTQDSDISMDDEAGADPDRAAPAPSSPPLPPPPGRQHHDMYIVQFPKDQVYRVPPRENALIVEGYRNPPKVKRRRCNFACSPRLLLTISIILVSIIAIVGITFAVLYFVFKPAGPTFTVTNLAIKKHGTGNKNSPPQYEVSLRAKNPNRRSELVYEENNDVSLMFEDTKVGVGKFPPLKQGRGASTEDVKVVLAGSNGSLPKQMEKSMNDGKSNTQIELGLDMKLRVKIIAAGLKTWVMNSNVACKFKVRGLGNDTSILSQECDANFKQL